MSYSDYLQRQPDVKKLGLLKRASWIASTVVFCLVVLTHKYKLDIGVKLSMLPPLNATFNTIVSICLILAVVAIKNKNITLHRRSIGVAVFFSVLFLLNYVAYHGTQEEVRYGGEGGIKIFYLLLLASHILLAAVSLPFILLTLSLGYTNHFERHKKMARWVFPLWLYVAVTGPACYLMLKPYY